MQLVAIQMTSTDDLVANLAVIEARLAEIDFSPKRENGTEDGHTLVLLPENFALFSSTTDYFKHAERLGDGLVQRQLSQWAKHYQCWLVAGSLPIISDTVGRVYSTSLAFDPSGQLVQHYNKIHLFDVDIDVSAKTDTARLGQRELCKESYKESDSFIAGDQVATFTAAGIKFGMAICYDLRFPELFRVLSAAQVDILLLPAAFTYTTGQAHWLPLLQARAIENQCYVLAANQVGIHPNGRTTWGHSVILDPWGTILAQQTSQCGIICSRLDKQKLVQIRTDMPILQHARFTARLKYKE
ncbi:MAG: putative amidohydrolase [Moritella sp.]|jgi:predicted amidohydrolase